MRIVLPRSKSATAFSSKAAAAKSRLAPPSRQSEPITRNDANFLTRPPRPAPLPRRFYGSTSIGYHRVVAAVKFVRAEKAILTGEPRAARSQRQVFSTKLTVIRSPRAASQGAESFAADGYQLWRFTQSRITALVSSAACQKNPCDWPFRIFISAPGMRSARTFDWAM